MTGKIRRKVMGAYRTIANQAILFSTLALLCTSAGQSHAAEPNYSNSVIRIGVLSDQSGPYSEIAGRGSAIAAQLAAEEFGQAIHGVPIEIVTADHQNKPDIGAA